MKAFSVNLLCKCCIVYCLCTITNDNDCNVLKIESFFEFKHLHFRSSTAPSIVWRSLVAV